MDKCIVVKNAKRVLTGSTVDTLHNDYEQVRSGQVWWHTPEQRVAASTLRRYSLGLRLAIAQADARPAMPVSFRQDST